MTAHTQIKQVTDANQQSSVPGLMVPFFLEKELCFPADYPVGCLLGCVDMIDCLSQEEYREQVCMSTYT